MTDNDQNHIIRIELTPEQTEKIKAETGKVATSFEFTAQELEERITPYASFTFTRLAGNHNETLLVE